MYSEGQVNSVVDEATKQKEEELNLEELKDISEERIENAPIVKLATAIVENAQRQDATDIHIEPFKDKTVIRIRVNGDLIELMTLSAALHTSLVTRFKILSGMNIAEKRIPQDGRMSQVVDGTTLDLRVSNLPMVYGEKVVLRILATGDMSLRKITDLGMTEYNYKRFESCLKVPQGVVLVTGPTGSGKSTTLYAALGEISKPNNNVITVEDPVEKKIDGVNQCQINEKAGMTFGAALRSILRQDPDIIMVGEMRDAETAEIAIRAAITGHLVLSTLHTNDAASTVTRLVDMGVEAYMVATSLIGIVAQRLTKVLCPECKSLECQLRKKMSLWVLIIQYRCTTHVAVQSAITQDIREEPLSMRSFSQHRLCRLLSQGEQKLTKFRSLQRKRAVTCFVTTFQSLFSKARPQWTNLSV